MPEQRIVKFQREFPANLVEEGGFTGEEAVRKSLIEARLLIAHRMGEEGLTPIDRPRYIIIVEQAGER